MVKIETEEDDAPDGEQRRRRHQRNQDGGGRGRSGDHKDFHNCGKYSHLVADCWALGGGNEGGGGENNDDTDDNEGKIPCVDPYTLRRPPHGVDPRSCTLPDGTDVKWCSLCGYWGK